MNLVQNNQFVTVGLKIRNGIVQLCQILMIFQVEIYAWAFGALIANSEVETDTVRRSRSPIAMYSGAHGYGKYKKKHIVHRKR